MDIQKEIAQYKAKIDGALKAMMAAEYPEVLYDAMGYSLLAEGKRVRPILLLAACRAAGGDENVAMPFACAMEMIHTYSLIHDDLPAMDNDDLRRGRPTSHKVYGEALAILAGDGLLNMAYETMANACLQYPGTHTVAAMAEIAGSAGARGMIGGQVADVISEHKKISEDTLLYIHGNKTAALIKAALKAGALLGLGGADASMVMRMEAAGVRLGMAFQIQDDILDVTSTTETLGKPVGSDDENGKNTYVRLFGLERAKRDYSMLSEAAFSMFDMIGDPFLMAYAAVLFNRNA